TGYGTFGYEPSVEYFFGVPRMLHTGGVAMDIPILRISEVDSQNINEKITYNFQVGMLSSALEHLIPEQFLKFGDVQPDATSAVKAIMKAAAQGQKLFHITSENQSNVLPMINHDQNTLTEIKKALMRGKEVMTHTDSIQVPGWTGSGYIIIDPQTGDGAFKIGGGLNGSYN
ncbi:MAG: hypothetical protein PVJ39_19395, partial [Gammaproteobacteria bacterium]